MSQKTGYAPIPKTSLVNAVQRNSRFVLIIVRKVNAHVRINFVSPPHRSDHLSLQFGVTNVQRRAALIDAHVLPLIMPLRPSDLEESVTTFIYTRFAILC